MGIFQSASHWKTTKSFQLHVPTEAHPEQQVTKTLCKLIKEIYGRLEYSKVILGHFNHPSITWNNLHFSTTDNHESRDPDNFDEAIIKPYLNLFVDFPTRGDGTGNPSCIDYVFTNNETLINGVSGGGPPRSSDHTLIKIDINTTPKDNSTHYKKSTLTKKTTHQCGNS